MQATRLTCNPPSWEGRSLSDGEGGSTWIYSPAWPSLKQQPTAATLSGPESPTLPREPASTHICWPAWSLRPWITPQRKVS